MTTQQVSSSACLQLRKEAQLSRIKTLDSIFQCGPPVTDKLQLTQLKRAWNQIPVCTAGQLPHTATGLQHPEIPCPLLPCLHRLSLPGWPPSAWVRWAISKTNSQGSHYPNTQCSRQMTRDILFWLSLLRVYTSSKATVAWYRFLTLLRSSHQLTDQPTRLFSLTRSFTRKSYLGAPTNSDS